MLGLSHIEALNEAGFIVVSSDYRLCPTISVLDGPVADSVAAYEWSQNELPKVLAKSHNIKVDGKNIVTLGHSCGGGLALLMVGVSHAYVVLRVFPLTRSIQAARPSPPKAILDFFGFKYLRDPFYHSGNQSQVSSAGPTAEFIKQVFKQVPPPTAAPPPFGPNGPDLSTPRGAYLVTSVRNGVQFDDIIAADEYDLIDPESLFEKPGFPPTFLVQGTADVVVDAKFAQQAYSRLRESGVPSELRLVEGAAHGFDAKINRDSPLFKVVQEGVDFLAEHV